MKSPKEKKKKDTQPTKEKKPKRILTKKEKIINRTFLVLTVISALIVVAFIAWNLFSMAPTLLGGEDTRPPHVTLTEDAQGNVIETVIPDISADRKRQYYTFLIAGQDTGGGGLTDTMILASYDVPNRQMNLMSIPRDTYVQVNGKRMLLNAVYNTFGGAEDDKGITALKREIGDLTGVVPDYHVIIQWKAVGVLVDTVGGVWFDVPRTMQYYDPTQNLRIDVAKGEQLLDGSKAMQVVRFREGANGYIDGDLGRIRTQQAFLKALVKKCLQPEVLLPNLTEFINIFQENVTTNLGARDISFFVKSAVGKLDVESIGFYTLPNDSAGDGHLIGIPSQITDLVNESFNPYKEDIRPDDLSVYTEKVTVSHRPKESEPAAEPTEAPTEEPTGSEPIEPWNEDEPLLPPEVSLLPPEGEEPNESGEPSTQPPETGEAEPTVTPVPETPIPEPSAGGGEDPLLPPGV